MVANLYTDKVVQVGVKWRGTFVVIILRQSRISTLTMSQRCRPYPKRQYARTLSQKTKSRSQSCLGTRTEEDWAHPRPLRAVQPADIGLPSRVETRSFSRLLGT